MSGASASAQILSLVGKLAEAKLNTKAPQAMVDWNRLCQNRSDVTDKMCCR